MEPVQHNDATEVAENDLLAQVAELKAQNARLLGNIERLMRQIGANPSQCQKCGRPIWFVKHKSGHTAPYTVEALNHFADCPNAQDFRKPKEA